MNAFQAYLLFIYTLFFQNVIICFLSSQQRGKQEVPLVEICNYNFITATNYTSMVRKLTIFHTKVHKLNRHPAMIHKVKKTDLSSSVMDARTPLVPDLLIKLFRESLRVILKAGN